MTSEPFSEKLAGPDRAWSLKVMYLTLESLGYGILAPAPARHARSASGEN